jgi:flagellar assembly protein FliH
MSTSATLVLPELAITPDVWRASVPGAATVRDFVLPPAESRTASAEREAYDRGFADGRQQATDAQAAVIAARVAKLVATINEVASLRTTMIKRSEQDIVRLALAMAGRILNREAAADSALLLTLAREATGKLAGTGVVSIEMHADDLAAIPADLKETGPVRAIENSDLPVGSCLVRSAAGSIDVSLDAQLQEIADALLNDDPSR